MERSTRPGRLPSQLGSPRAYSRRSSRTEGYKVSGGSSEGLTRINPESGAQGEASAKVKGAGPLLPDPARPLVVPSLYSS